LAQGCEAQNAAAADRSTETDRIERRPAKGINTKTEAAGRSFPLPLSGGCKARLGTHAQAPQLLIGVGKSLKDLLAFADEL
jgi:hypothetical protein